MSILGKIFHAGQAQANKAANEALNADPLAVMQLDIDTALEQIHSLTPDMETLKGQVNRMARQFQDEEKDIASLNAKVDLLVKAGNDAGAAQLDQQLQSKENAHENTKVQLAKLQGSYDTTKDRINQANKTIAEKQQKAQSLGMELKISEANKKAIEASAAVLGRLNSATSLGHMSDAERILQEKIDANNAAADVQADLSGPAPSDADALSASLDAQVAAAASTDRLAARKAKLGMGSGNIAADVAVTAVKSIKTTEPVTVITTTTVTPNVKSDPQPA